MKQLEEMTLEELYQFRTIVETINTKYTNSLTTYSITHDDKYFQNMSRGEEILFEKKNKLTKLINKVDALIESKLSSYYE